jgi:hypothetical protein
MFKLSKNMTALMLNSVRNSESGFSSSNNQYLNAILYTGGDLSPGEIAAFENAGTQTGAANTYTRNYTAAYNLLASTRTLLAQTPTAISPLIQRFQNFGKTPDKSIWRLSQLAPLSVSSSGVAGLLVIKFSSTPNSATTARLVFVFTVGLPGSGAEIELTETNLVAGSLVYLNDIEIDYQGLM